MVSSDFAAGFFYFVKITFMVLYCKIIDDIKDLWWGINEKIYSVDICYCMDGTYF